MRQVQAMLLSSPMEVYNFTINNGGKAVFVTEDDEPSIRSLPNKLEASILLPPYEAIAAELDGDYATAETLYVQWLYTKECKDYINLITFAIMQGIPVGLYFGHQIQEMRYPSVLMRFFQAYMGVTFGNGMTLGVYDDQFTPINLGEFLLNFIIKIPDFFALMPVDCDIPPMVISYLTEALQPPMRPGATLGELNEYFKGLIRQSHQCGRYVYNPIKAGALI
jgi:hypothetical protein